MCVIKLASVAAMLLSALPALAAGVPETAAGVIKTSKGNVIVERDGRKAAATPGATIMAADRILTGPDGSTGITLRDETLLALGPNTTLAMNQFAFDPVTHAGRLDASVRRGTMAVISGKLAKASPDAVRFSTPATVLGVRGTEFVIEVEDE